MARAICRNESCEKDSWRLTKHPDEYSGGGPSCPECGTTRVDIEYDEGESSHGQQTERRGGAPARAQSGGQATGLANTDADTASDALAQAGVGLASEETGTVEKIQLLGKLSGFLTDTATRAAQYSEQLSEQREARAEQSDLGRAKDLPECPYCGSVIEEVPVNKDRFNCPKCGEPIEIVE